MGNETRNHKDNVFCMIYREKQHLLSLYNALNGTEYSDENELEIITLKDSICMKMKNDAALIIDRQMALYEQQSSVNPNMPLRYLYYVAEELKTLIKGEALYRKTPVTLPVPEFVVFYNGNEEQPAKKLLKLSDLYEKQEKEQEKNQGKNQGKTPQLELIVTMLNVNPGKNEELLDCCESLKGYMAFVNKVREKQRNGQNTRDAVIQSVDECIREGILADFFKKYREEVIDVSIWEYDEELHNKAMREDGRVEGREEGRKEGETKKLIDLVSKKVKKGKSVEIIVDELEEDLTVLAPVYRAVIQCGAETGIEHIYEVWLENKKRAEKQNA